jgi:short-subunit dehydrogenase
VINAGMGQFGPFAVTAWDDVTALLRVNVEGALATARAVLPGMLRRRAGSLVFISSVLGKRAIPWNAVYCASKHALFGFADALRLEVREAGVHVGVVAPARTATQFFDSMTYTVPQTRRRSVPEQTPESVARLVLHCVLHRRRECVASASGKLYAFIGYHFPRITDAVFRRAVIAPESHGHPNASPADPL